EIRNIQSELFFLYSRFNPGITHNQANHSYCIEESIPNKTKESDSQLKHTENHIIQSGSTNNRKNTSVDRFINHNSDSISSDRNSFRSPGSERKNFIYWHKNHSMQFSKIESGARRILVEPEIEHQTWNTHNTNRASDHCNAHEYESHVERLRNQVPQEESHRNFLMYQNGYPISPISPISRLNPDQTKHDFRVNDVVSEVLVERGLEWMSSRGRIDIGNSTKKFARPITNPRISTQPGTNSADKIGFEISHDRSSINSQVKPKNRKFRKLPIPPCNKGLSEFEYEHNSVNENTNLKQKCDDSRNSDKVNLSEVMHTSSFSKSKTPGMKSYPDSVFENEQEAYKSPLFDEHSIMSYQNENNKISKGEENVPHIVNLRVDHSIFTMLDSETDGSDLKITPFLLESETSSITSSSMLSNTYRISAPTQPLKPYSINYFPGNVQLDVDIDLEFPAVDIVGDWDDDASNGKIFSLKRMSDQNTRGSSAWYPFTPLSRQSNSPDENSETESMGIVNTTNDHSNTSEEDIISRRRKSIGFVASERVKSLGRMVSTSRKSFEALKQVLKPGVGTRRASESNMDFLVLIDRESESSKNLMDTPLSRKSRESCNVM
ncbi:hypothetical protein HK096_006070, partial [Nowakowskiella sp. JEL0078]